MAHAALEPQGVASQETCPRIDSQHFRGSRRPDATLPSYALPLLRVQGVDQRPRNRRAELCLEPLFS